MGESFEEWGRHGGGWEWLNPYSASLDAARSFYQPWVLDQLLAQEKHERTRREIVGSGQLIDDVAGQLHT